MCSCGLDLREIVTDLESDFIGLLELLTNNGMVANRKENPAYVPRLERPVNTAT